MVEKKTQVKKLRWGGDLFQRLTKASFKVPQGRKKKNSNTFKSTSTPSDLTGPTSDHSRSESFLRHLANCIFALNKRGTKHASRQIKWRAPDEQTLCTP